MSLTKQIESNQISPLMLILEALAGRHPFTFAMRSLRRYCLDYGLKPSLHPSRLFITFAEGNSHRCNYLADCLNGLYLGEGIVELVLYLQYRAGLKTLKEHIKRNIRRYDHWPEDWTAIPQHYLLLDKSLRQRWALQVDLRHFNLHIFDEPSQLNMVLVNNFLADFAHIDSPTIDGNTDGLLAALALAVIDARNSSLSQFLDKYWLMHDDNLSTSASIIKLLQAIAAVCLHHKEALLLIRGNIFYLKQDADQRVLITKGRLQNSPLLGGEEIYESIQERLGQSIQLRLMGERILGYGCDFWGSISGILDLLGENKASFTDLNYRSKLSNKAKQEVALIKKQKKLESQEKQALAVNQLDNIATYKPKFFDILGYDFSGSRRRMVEDILRNSADSKIEHFYGDCLKKLRKAQKHNSLYRDMMLGVFVHNMIEDSGLSKQQINTMLHPKLIKLVEASKAEYNCEKRSAMRCDSEKQIEICSNDLVEKLFASLCKTSGNMLKQLAIWRNIVQTWFDKTLQQADVSARPKRLRKDCHCWFSLLDNALKHNLESKYIGKIISKICYLRAVQHMKICHHDEEGSLLSQYQSSLSAISPDMHNMYLEYLKTVHNKPC